ncbi:ankyrin repeat-containing domain protein [Aspergillus germanicus]
MACTLIKLPLEINLEIGEYLVLTDLPNLIRTCKFFTRIHSRRLYDRRLSNAKLDGWFLANRRSEFVLEYVTAMADRLLPTNDHWSNTLLKSIEEGDNELWLDIFIKRGIDINKKDEHGWSLLHFALEDGRDKVVNKLLDAGADVLSPAGGRIPTVGLPSNANHLSRATFDRLIATFEQAGGDISALAPDGSRTALHYASRRGDFLTLKTLIEHGADVQAKNINGHIPLVLAFRFRNYLSSEILLEAMVQDPRGYDLNDPIPIFISDSKRLPWGEKLCQCPNGTILHLAVVMEDSQAVRLLLDHGADPQAEDQATPFFRQRLRSVWL